MGPSVSFPLPLRIAQKLPICNSLEFSFRKVTDTVTDLFFLFFLID